jgi:hypothetical protein
MAKFEESGRDSGHLATLACAGMPFGNVYFECLAACKHSSSTCFTCKKKLG